MTAVEGITVFALIIGAVSSVLVAQEMQKRAALYLRSNGLPSEPFRGLPSPRESPKT